MGGLLIPRRSLVVGAAALAAHEALAVPGLKPMGGFMATQKGATTAWNPNDAGSGFTFSNNNLTWSNSTAARTVRATTSRTTGKVYFEFTVTAVGFALRVGVANAAASIGIALGNDVNGLGYTSVGTLLVNGAAQSGTWATYTTGDVIGVAMDVANTKAYFSKNGVWQNSANPSAGTGGFAFATTGPYAASSTGTTGSGSAGGTANFGQSAFAYTPPTGFVAWG